MKAPRICIFDDHEAMSRAAAEHIQKALAAKPDMLLCAAGGNTPLRCYDLLAQGYAREAEAFRSLRLVKLDEWGGLVMNAAGTCERQMQDHLIGPLHIADERYLGFSSDAADPNAECARVGQRIEQQGPIDVCILGLGMNGHVAMNEPAAILRPYSHVAQLAATSLKHTMLSVASNTPTFGLSLGMTEILASREILLFVTGANKQEPLRRLFTREITTQFPASFLWLHPNWTLLCDHAAKGGLDLKG